MYINSPGGVVTAGLAIYDTMQVKPTLWAPQALPYRTASDMHRRLSPGTRSAKHHEAPRISPLRCTPARVPTACFRHLTYAPLQTRTWVPGARRTVLTSACLDQACAEELRELSCPSFDFINRTGLGPPHGTWGPWHLPICGLEHHYGLCPPQGCLFLKPGGLILTACT